MKNYSGMIDEISSFYIFQCSYNGITAETFLDVLKQLKQSVSGVDVRLKEFIVSGSLFLPT